MTRRRNNAPVRRRNAKRRKKPRASRAVLPPARTISGHIMRSIIQTAWDIAQGALSALPQHPVLFPVADTFTTIEHNPNSWDSGAMTAKELLAQGWLDRLKGMFREIKLHKITAHYMPYCSTTAMGEYAFTLWDADENDTPKSFSKSLGMPASVIRRSAVPSRLVWVPTEPDDRNWHLLSDDHKYCQSTIQAAEAFYHAQPDVATTATDVYQESANVSGKIIIEVDASYRGKPSSNALANMPSSSSGYLRYCELTKCTCSKCERLTRLTRLEAVTNKMTPKPVKHPPLSPLSSSFSVVSLEDVVTRDSQPSGSQ